MRSFIALELPVDFANETAALARHLSESIEGRFMHRDSYHITLAFLGDASEQDIASAMAALEAVAMPGGEGAKGGEGAAPVAPVPLACAGLGKFGRSSDATLWLGLREYDSLVDLAARVRDQLDARGVHFDTKPFKPHITLARRARLSSVALTEVPFPRDAFATRITLFRSELSSEGARYKPLYSVSLAQRQ